jgi:hypothetical protein
MLVCVGCQVIMIGTIIGFDLSQEHISNGPISQRFDMLMALSVPTRVDDLFEQIDLTTDV